MNARSTLRRLLAAGALALLFIVASLSPTLANVNPPVAPLKNPPAELATMAPAQRDPELVCDDVARRASGDVSMSAPSYSHLLPDAAGGAAIGAVAGTLAKNAGRGAAIGALAGAVFGGIADAQASAAWQRQRTKYNAAYDSCIASHR